MRAFDIPFQETVIPLRQPDTNARILQYSPTGKVPVLIDASVDGSEAIVGKASPSSHYLAERFPGKPMWPKGRGRAGARQGDLDGDARGLSDAAPDLPDEPRQEVRGAADDRRPEAQSRSPRGHVVGRRATASGTSDGRISYGAFSAADAMFAPVVTRLDSYQPACRRRYPRLYGGSARPSRIPAVEGRARSSSRGGFPTTRPDIRLSRTT